ncbi:autotransporter outer membrane beta-barrel domain-containing protein [uncultured Duodenibacillus sp.]|uniref:beta strand repeat-containing protein n=1 Tax=uncultured Duodenibacillus sp. TaxID=1980699 RepID=UPI00258ACA6A|nr:autotransporter outer membrane beta-barrel domain-containing protein [uncultured Duodenibacillus sp.]
MVVNEATSSVQAKGTKTVIAAAAAAMLAGSAMATPTPAAEAFIGDGSSAVITRKIEGAAATATSNNVFTEVYTSTTEKTPANKLDGTHQTYGTSTKLQMVGNGTLDIIATDKSSESATGDRLEAGTINFTANDSGATANNATYTYAGQEAIGGVTLNFNANTGTKTAETVKGTSGLTSNNALTLGTAQGTGQFATSAQQTKVVVAAGANAQIKSEAALTLADVAITNEGALELAGSSVALNSDYTTQAGTLTVTVKGADSAATIGSVFTGKNVLIAADADTIKDVKFTEKFIGAVKVAGKDSALTADTVTVYGKDLAVENQATTKVGTMTFEGAGVLAVGNNTASTEKTTAAVDNLVLKGKSNAASVDVKANGVLTGKAVTAAGAGNKITNAGAVTYDTVSVGVTGDATSDLTIDNTGKFTATDITVTGAATQGATLTIADGAATNGGTLTAKTVTVKGVSNTNSKFGELVINSANPAAAGAGEATKYTVAAESLDVQDFGKVTLTKGSLKADTLTVAANGSVTTAATSSGAVFGTVTNNGTLTLGSATDITGKSVNAGTLTASGALNIKGDFTNQKKLNGEVVAGNFNAGVVNVSGANFVNEGMATLTGKLTLSDGATFTTALKDTAANTPATGAWAQLSDVEATGEGSALIITGYNSKVDSKATTPNDLLSLSGALTLTDGAKLAVTGVEENALKVTLGGATTLNNTTQNFGSVSFGDQGSLILQAKSASTIGTLDQTKGTVTVSGDLTVTDKLVTVDSNKKNFTVVEGGTLTTTKTAVGLTINTDKSVKWTTKVEGRDVAHFNGIATNAGKVVLTGAEGTVSEASINDIAQKFGTTLGASYTGLLDVGALTVEGLVGSDGKISATKATAYAGLISNDTKSHVTTGIAKDAKLAGEYQAIELGASGGYTVAGDLTLNNNGSLVTFTSETNGVKTTKDETVEISTGGRLSTTGTGAKLSAVKLAAEDAELNVKAGDLTVNADSTATADADKIVAINAANSGAVNVADGAALLVNGNISGTATLNVDGAMTMGKVTQNKVEADAWVNAHALNVAATGVYTAAGKTTLATSSNVLGTATFGVLDLTNATHTLSVGSSTATVGGHATINNLMKGVVKFDPAFDPKTHTLALDKATTGVVNSAATTDASVQVLHGSVVGIGAGATTEDAVKAFAATGYTLGERVPQADGTILNKDADVVASAVVVSTYDAAAKKHVSFDGALYAGNKMTTADASQDVTFAAESMLIVDGTKVDTTGATKVFSKDVTFEAGATLALSNIGNGDKVVLGTLKGTSAQNIAKELKDAEFTGDILMSASLVQDKTTKVESITVAMKDKAAVKDVFGDLPGIDAAYEMFKGKLNNGTSSSVAFNNWLYTGANHASVAAFQAAAKDVASLGTTTGVQTMTMDAVNQMGETVADRVSLLTQRAAGVNVWAAANGGMFEAKSLFDGAGYESDIYSGVLGVDYQFACNAVLGAALTIGTADTDNKNSTVKASTDSDLVGFSVYASKTFADVLGVSADIGYLTASNDVTANGYGQSWKFSQDTDAFTIGLRTEVLAEVGAVKLVPHIGIRYTALSTDGFEAGYKTEIDDQNIFQMPVGVTVSGDFQTGDWTVAPKFDLSFVPTFGDKDADLKLGITGVNATDDLAVRVIDSNPVQATLGVNATNGAWGFGLNYKLGVGSDDRMNNTFNVNVRYAF